MDKRYTFLFRSTLIFLDLLVINNSFLFGFLYIPVETDNDLLSPVYLSLIGFNVIWFLIALLFGLYRYKNLSGLEHIFRATWRTAALHLLVISSLCIALFKREADQFSLSLGVCYSIMVVLFILNRFFLTYIVDFLIEKGKLKSKIAIIGYNETARQLADRFSVKRSTYNFEGFFDDSYNIISPVNGMGQIIAPLQKSVTYAVEKGITEIYSTLLPEDHNGVELLMKEAQDNCVRIRFVPDGNNAIPENYHLLYAAEFPVIGNFKEPLSDIRNRMKKRVFDLVFSFLVIVFILSWLVPLIGLLIKLESRGPVFFVQKRSGRNNRAFWCFKFRSMAVNDDADAVQASKTDTRITKVGAFLRKTSMDELPQFLNVFRGDMSIAGPRPHMVAHTEKYSREISQFMVRHFVKPGITGWAQANGYRGETEEPGLMEKRVQHDIWYLEHWSLMLDIRIVFLTIINIFRGEERAY